MKKFRTRASGTPNRVTVYPFHGRHSDLPDLFHVSCDDHPDFGHCGPEADAHEAAAEHLRGEHS